MKKGVKSKGIKLSSLTSKSKMNASNDGDFIGKSPPPHKAGNLTVERI